MQPTLPKTPIDIAKSIREPKESPIILLPGKKMSGNKEGREEIEKKWGDEPSEIIINPAYLSPYHEENKEITKVSQEQRNALGKDVSDATSNEIEILPQEKEEKEELPSDEEMKNLIKIIEKDETKTS